MFKVSLLAMECWDDDPAVAVTRRCSVAGLSGASLPCHAVRFSENTHSAFAVQEVLPEIHHTHRAIWPGVPPPSLIKIDLDSS